MQGKIVVIKLFSLFNVNFCVNSVCCFWSAKGLVHCTLRESSVEKGRKCPGVVGRLSTESDYHDRGFYVVIRISVHCHNNVATGIPSMLPRQGHYRGAFSVATENCHNRRSFCRDLSFHVTTVVGHVRGFLCHDRVKLCRDRVLELS